MNSENSKTYNYLVLVLKLTGKLHLKGVQILVFTMHGKT